MCSTGGVFSLCNDELLIEEVRQRPVLYDQRLKSHRDKQLQNDAWLQISSALNQTTAVLQHRWNYLRQKFLRLRKVYVKSGSGAADVEKAWVLMPNLMFLVDAIQRRSLARRDEPTAAVPLTQQPLEPVNDSIASVEGLCRTFYIDSTQEEMSLPEDIMQVSPLPEASRESSNEGDNRSAANVPSCSGETAASDRSKRTKRKKSDLDDLMLSTLQANRHRLNELKTAAMSVDDDEHFLLSLKGLLGKVDERRKELLKLKIHKLLVEEAFKLNDTDV
uniref:MADF domain-containing protein n=1 Tax=Amblyomma maculatum TaxID=34609 RepID=G3ML77_AMBMU